MDAPMKKDKGTAPESKECANCLARLGVNGDALLTCSRCKLSSYCGKVCQATHWKAGHKQFCITPEERRAPLQKLAGCSATASSSYAKPQPDECPICLDPLASGIVCTLPCTHIFHASCVEGLRKFGIKQVCPMCRVELPPGPDQLCEEAGRRYFSLARRVDRGEMSWGAPTNAQRRETNEVIGMMRQAAEQGSVEAMFVVGFMYSQGHGVQQNNAEAARWLRQAAELGDADAQFSLGSLYFEGLGVKQDLGEALRLWRKAAEQGDVEALTNLGTMHVTGRGVKKDYFEAARLFRKAAGQGNAQAQYSLGCMYNYGEGVKQDVCEAVQLWRKAAEQGHASAQSIIGNMYAAGLGVPQDYGEAFRWWGKAVEQGDKGAKESSRRLKEKLREERRAAPVSQTSPLRTCANCGSAEAATGVALKPCSRCKAAVYCGKECQAQHWQEGGHRAVCRMVKGLVGP